MEQKDNQDGEHSLQFAIRSTIIMVVMWIFIKNVIFANLNFETEIQFAIIDGLIRAAFALLAILVFGKIIGSNGFKFAFTTKGFKKGMFAHIPMFLLGFAMPLIALSIPEAQLVFEKVVPWLLPALFSNISNAVWEDVLWNGVLMTGMLIKWSSTWDESSTVKKRVAFMLICSLAFGMMHFSSGGILHVFSAIASGAVFGAAYIYSKNLLACFVAHTWINFITAVTTSMFYDIELIGLFHQKLFIVATAWGVVVMIPFAIYLTVKAEPFWSLEEDRSV